MNETPFQNALKLNIQDYIRTARADGTTAMSLENLIMCVRPPSTSLIGAPLGTNASHTYANMFREICESTRAFKSFLL